MEMRDDKVAYYIGQLRPAHMEVSNLMAMNLATKCDIIVNYIAIIGSV